MRHGKFVIGIATINHCREKVFEGTMVAQPTTVHTFTGQAGQGSQEQGRGMGWYNSSPAARAVWDSVNAHLISAYGFSIVEIV